MPHLPKKLDNHPGCTNHLGGTRLTPNNSPALDKPTAISLPNFTASCLNIPSPQAIPWMDTGTWPWQDPKPCAQHALRLTKKMQAQTFEPFNCCKGSWMSTTPGLRKDTGSRPKSIKLKMEVCGLSHVLWWWQRLTEDPFLSSAMGAALLSC